LSYSSNRETIAHRQKSVKLKELLLDPRRGVSPERRDADPAALAGVIRNTEHASSVDKRSSSIERTNL